MTTYQTIDAAAQVAVAELVVVALRTMDLPGLETDVRPPYRDRPFTTVHASYQPPYVRISGIPGPMLPGECAGYGGGTSIREVFVDRWGRVNFHGWFPGGFGAAVQPLRDSGIEVYL